MSIKTMRRALLIFLVSMVLLAGSVVWLLRYAAAYPDRPIAAAGQPIKVTIPHGSAFPKVVQILEKASVIRSGTAFRIFANYKGLASKVRAGNYTFKPSITPRNLLDILVHGVPAPTVSVLIPEGKNMLEVADILAEARIARKSDLLREMRNRRFLHRVGVEAETIEGYLFPDTYKLKTYSPAEEVLERLVRRHNSVYFSLVAKHKSGLAGLRRKLRWNHHEIVIMASIVEKETGQPKERPLIAGVFLNRLTLPGFRSRLLQTDPTIVYGCVVPQEKSSACKRFKGRIRRIHLNDAENPYNTYQHSRLPPGPIANPGRAALEAVLKPKRSRYLFFVSKNDGTHYFSRTEAEHERAVDRYQRRRKTPKP